MRLSVQGTHMGCHGAVKRGVAPVLLRIPREVDGDLAAERTLQFFMTLEETAVGIWSSIFRFRDGVGDRCAG